MRSTLLFLALLPSMLFAQQFEWGQAFGGNQNDNAQRISSGPAGSIFVVGNFIGPATISTTTLEGFGFQDVYLARYSSTGQLVWAKAIGGAGTDQVSAIETDLDGNIWVSGRFTGSIDLDPGEGATLITSAPANGLDGFFAKFSGEDGSLLDFRDISPGGTLDIRSIKIDAADGSFYLGGQYANTVDFDFGPFTQNRTSFVTSGDCFVAKYSSTLGFGWANTFGSVNPAIDFVSSIALSNDGAVYCTGLLGGTTDIDPSIGTTNLTCATDAFLIRYNKSNGSLAWGFNLGANSIEVGTAVLVNPDDEVILTGTMNSPSFDVDPGFGTTTIASNGISSAPFLLRYGNNGSLLGNYVTEGLTGLAASMSALEYSATNEIVVAGNFTGTIKFPTDTGYYQINSGDSADAFIAFYNHDFLLMNINIVGGSNNQTANDIKLSGNVMHLAGQLDGTTNPGFGALNPIVPVSAGNEGFVFQYNLNPTAINSHENRGVVVFPNPTQNWIQIDASDFQHAEMFDLNGRLVIKSDFHLINCAHLEKGIYLLSVRTNSDFVVKKIVVQ
jgi:hypothetical protein